MTFRREKPIIRNFLLHLGTSFWRNAILWRVKNMAKWFLLYNFSCSMSPLTVENWFFPFGLTDKKLKYYISIYIYFYLFWKSCFFLSFFHFMELKCNLSEQMPPVSDSAENFLWNDVFGYEKIGHFKIHIPWKLPKKIFPMLIPIRKINLE